MNGEPHPIESDVLRPARTRPPADTIAIDINADVGEGHPDETKIMAYVSSVSVACGGHAGDPATLRRLLNVGLQYGTSLGAHPGYEDRGNMGRKPLDLPPAALKEQLLRQLTLFRNTLFQLGGKWQHVKLHGALYHQAAQERPVAETVLAVLGQVCPKVYLFSQPHGWLYTLAGETGIRVVPEFFADRGYREDGTLIPRGEPGDLITDPEQVIENVRRMARQYCDGVREEGGPPQASSEPWNEVSEPSESPSGLDLFLSPDLGRRPPAVGLHPTFCLHSDTPNALALVRWLRIGLSRSHVDVASYPAA